MKTIVLLLLFFTNTLLAQNLIDYSIKEIEWKNWDNLNGDTQGKLDFVKKHFVEKHSGEGDPNTFVPSDAKILDINGDGKLDMLYLGSGTFRIYLSMGDSLRIIKSINGQITELSKGWPDAPLNFTTVDLDCCQAGEWEIKYYQFFTEDSNFGYKLYRTEIIRQGMKDLFRNMPPTQVKVGSSSADLVLGPGSSEIINTYETGRSGYAIASIKDDNGRLWWKVFIKEPDYKLRVGWIDKNKLVTIYPK